MKLYFLLTEVFMYGLAGYIFLNKKELAIVYIPAVVFANTVITPVLPAFVFYLIVSFLILSLLYRNATFYRNNIYSIIIFFYFIILLFQSSDLTSIRPFLFAVLWFFLSLPLISAIYKKHQREAIFKELATSAFIILSVFSLSVIASSIFRYSTHTMYGISSGVLYGNLTATNFNILAIATFIVLLRLLTQRNLTYLLVTVISLAFIILSLRRSVILVAILGIGTVILLLVAQKNVKKVIIFGFLAAFIGLTVVLTTDFASVFLERYEMRKLDERELEEEKRFMEYELILKDMFFYEDYSPFFGYEIFNSWGNYGRGIMGERSLHADITSIAHSSGFIGVILYLLMIMTAFLQAIKAARTKTDKLIILFCSAAFLMYTITGRYTEVGCMMLLFLVLKLPLARRDEEVWEAPEPPSVSRADFPSVFKRTVS